MPPESRRRMTPLSRSDPVQRFVRQRQRFVRWGHSGLEAGPNSRKPATPDPYLTLIPLAQRQQAQEGFGRVRPKLAGERHKLHRRGGES